MHSVSKKHYTSKDNKPYFSFALQNGRGSYQTVLVFDMSKRNEIHEFHQKKEAVCLTNVRKGTGTENNAVYFFQEAEIKPACVGFTFKPPPYTNILELGGSKRFIDSMKLKCIKSGEVKTTRYDDKLLNFVMMDEIGHFVRLEAWGDLINLIRPGITYYVNKVTNCYQGYRSLDNSDEDSNTANSNNGSEDLTTYIRTQTNTEFKECDSSIDLTPRDEKDLAKIESIISNDPICHVSGKILGIRDMQKYKCCPDCLRKIDVPEGMNRTNTVICPNYRCELVNRITDLDQAMYVKFRLKPDDGASKSSIVLTCFNAVLDEYLPKSCLKLKEGDILKYLRKKKVKIEYYVNKNTVQAISAFD